MLPKIAKEPIRAIIFIVNIKDPTLKISEFTQNYDEAWYSRTLDAVFLILLRTLKRLNNIKWTHVFQCFSDLNLCAMYISVNNLLLVQHLACSFLYFQTWGCIFICQLGCTVILVRYCLLSDWMYPFRVARSPGCMLGPPCGTIGASVWVVGRWYICDCCYWTGNHAILLLQRRAWLSRAGANILPPEGYHHSFQGPSHLLALLHLESSCLPMKNICCLSIHHWHQPISQAPSC